MRLENHAGKDQGSPSKGTKATILMPNGASLRTTLRRGDHRDGASLLKPAFSLNDDDDEPCIVMLSVDIAFVVLLCCSLRKLCYRRIDRPLAIVSFVRSLISLWFSPFMEFLAFPDLLNNTTCIALCLFSSHFSVHVL